MILEALYKILWVYDDEHITDFEKIKCIFFLKLTNN
jgi:hypothetical protein